MRRKFWTFVHDRLEDAWHWVYYHKLAEPLPEITLTNYQYHISYVCGRTGMLTDVSPVQLNDPDRKDRCPEEPEELR